MSSPDRATQVRSGSCLCRAVKYQVTGDPFTFRVCHCMNCRKATGSAFMTNVFFNAEKVRIIQGEEKLKIYPDGETASGIPLNRYFCTSCGSNILLRSADTPTKPAHDITIIALGTLDDETDWKPRTELWPEQRRHFISGIKVQKRPSAAKL